MKLKNSSLAFALAVLTALCAPASLVARAQSGGGSAPANDNFANAVYIGSKTTGSVTGTNVNATREAGEPPAIPGDAASGGTPGGRSVWFKWESPIHGIVTFDTIGSDYDTTLGAYTGDDLNALRLAAVNDDIDTAAGNVASRVSFFV